MKWIASIGLALLAACHAPAQPPAGSQAQAKPATGDVRAVDYAADAAWICRPGVDDGTCSANLDAVAIDAAGRRSPAPFVAAADPQVDCFYVYPTVSHDPTLYADMNVGAEERRAVHGQAARLRAACRLFAPAYHQVTAAGLDWSLRAGRGGRDAGLPLDLPYRDVLAAWRDYLRRDNHGRGVILVGHSQGAMLLKRLIAEEIDGRPAQRLLVAAYLAGNVGLTDKSFRAVPPCTAAGATGCVVAWSSYAEGDAGARFFGGDAPGGRALCTDPAAPAGGRGALTSFLPNPLAAPGSDEPPFIELIGQLSAACVADAGGSVLRVRIDAPRYARLLGAMMARFPPGWGLHPIDVALVQGNMIEMMAAQAAAWRRR